ncbi:MAG: hypothetical protein SP1CHLAM54_12050 [Chlamydiia bacterium]|nr:hypothetical protein [Chlamydiia bacterium]MCH9616104.1 hypothetical protein [Chlamydiia bacterium]MCH9629473.1 hypothetical protein [Chlamydiia bacterium]
MTILARPLDRIAFLYPYLIYGAAALIGIAIAKTGMPFLLLFTLPLLMHRITPLFIALFFILYAQIIPHHSNATAPFDFKIHSMTTKTTPFHTLYRYDGTVNGFGRVCYFSRDQSLKAPVYRIEKGSLKNGYIKCRKPIPQSKKTSLAYKRFQLKKKVAAFIKKNYPTREHHELLTALTTGIRTNHLMTYQFARLGLAHLLAISGFHFALLGYLLYRCLLPFLAPSSTNIYLLILLSIYFVFLGPSPSISRAYIAALLVLFAPFVHQHPNPINALGFALMVALIANPHIAQNAGFQLSFAATLGILTGTKTILNWINRLLPPPTPYELKRTHYPLFYKLSKPIRPLLALNLSVHLATLPILLTTFHTFPLASLIYNLFFPFLITLTLALFCLQLHALNIPLLHLIHHLLSAPPSPLLLDLTIPLPLILTPLLLALTLRTKEAVYA